MSQYIIKVERRKLSGARYHIYKIFVLSTIEEAKVQINWILNVLFEKFSHISFEKINDSIFVTYRNEKLIISLCKY